MLNKLNKNNQISSKIRENGSKRSIML